MPDIGLKPCLQMKKIALVVPRDSELVSAPPEQDYMMSLHNEKSAILYPYLRITRMLLRRYPQVNTTAGILPVTVVSKIQTLTCQVYFWKAATY